MDLYKIYKDIKHPGRLVKRFCDYKNHRYAYLIPDELYVRCFYKIHMGKRLRLHPPRTFNEKLQWLKLHDRNPQYTRMVDKAAAKDFIAEKIGRQYTIPTIGVYDSFDQIDFKELPNQFVMKCTHDSQSTIICMNKSELNIQKTANIINQCLQRNYFYDGREWPYKNIKPRIIIEELLLDNKNRIPEDIKFFCFHGEMRYFKVDINRFTEHRANYYNGNLCLQEFGEEIFPPDFSFQYNQPNNISKMIELAETLAHGIPFLRVDMYNVNQHIYVGELTFYPGGGTERFIPDTADYELGKMIHLPCD